MPKKKAMLGGLPLKMWVGRRVRADRRTGGKRPQLGRLTEIINSSKVAIHFGGHKSSVPVEIGLLHPLWSENPDLKTAALNIKTDKKKMTVEVLAGFSEPESTPAVPQPVVEKKPMSRRKRPSVSRPAPSRPPAPQKPTAASAPVVTDLPKDVEPKLEPPRTRKRNVLSQRESYMLLRYLDDHREDVLKRHPDDSTLAREAAISLQFAITDANVRSSRAIVDMEYETDITDQQRIARHLSTLYRELNLEVPADLTRISGV